jgi:hypothetical protein
MYFETHFDLRLIFAQIMRIFLKSSLMHHYLKFLTFFAANLFIATLNTSEALVISLILIFQQILLVQFILDTDPIFHNVLILRHIFHYVNYKNAMPIHQNF